MGLVVNSVEFVELTADPGAPVEGEAWFNTTDGRYKIYQGGAVQVLSEKGELDTHEGTANPHGTTLENARAAGSTLAGDINMGGNKVTNASTDASDSSFATNQNVDDKIRARLAAFDYQDSVLDKDIVDPTPLSPTTGQRYLIGGTGAGAWAGKDNQIAEWDGAVWLYAVPTLGTRVYVEDENRKYEFVGSTWQFFEETHDHGQLIGLGDDDHTQYVLASGSRSMAGNLDLGTNSITNVNLVDGVDIPDHSARHDPGGTDALTTAAASGLDSSSTNAEGSAVSLARSDHGHAIDSTNGTISTVNGGDTAQAGSGTGFSLRDHQHAVATAAAVSITTSNAEGNSTDLARANHTHNHGDQNVESHHSLVTSTLNGFQPRSNRTATTDPTANEDSGDGYQVGSYWVNTSTDDYFVCLDNTVTAAVWGKLTNGASGYLAHKSGRVLAATFAGNPKTATVTFSAAFPDTNYSVVLGVEATAGKIFSPVATSKTTGGFTIDTGTNNITGLTLVGWQAMVDGEST